MCSLLSLYFYMQYGCGQFVSLQLTDSDWKGNDSDNNNGCFLCLVKRGFIGSAGMVSAYSGLENRKRLVASSEKVCCTSCDDSIGGNCWRLLCEIVAKFIKKNLEFAGIFL